MSGSNPRQGGDAALGRLLAEHGSRYDAAGLRALLAGVVAAPEPHEPGAWMALVIERPSEELAAHLAALREEVARSSGGGLAAGKAASGERLAALRAELARRGLAGFVVPRSDEHQGENVPPHARRLAWLTGFTGSAGLAVVLADEAAIFVDGRYTLQVREEVDTGLFEPRHLVEEPPADWIAERLPAGAGLGYDSWLHSEEARGRLAAAAERADGRLAPCEDNPLDAVWTDRPAPPIAPVAAHDLAYAGRASTDKRAEAARALAAARAQAAVLTLPDSIAWLLNVRGGDVPHTPVALSFAVLHADARVAWFVDSRKLTPGVRAALDEAVEVAAPEQLGPALDAFGAAGSRVLADPATAPAWVFDRLRAAGAGVVEGEDPCLGPKARKNEVELAGARAAHRRDGAALVRFLCWLAREAPARAGGRRPVTELEAAGRLAALRAEGELFRGPSFDTISAAGEHGAIPHYRVGPDSDRPLAAGELYLVDSGGHYLDGTTDVTRTVAVGAPSAEMRERYTRVLKGHIALATARFPQGTTGSQLDALARLALWRVGLDYDHGTGHGVGSYLSVHEGPQRLSKLPNRVALAPGMICSNEPGYYKEGAYGIRIENLVAVRAAPREGDERDMLGFETLTLAPLERRLVDPGLLTAEEGAWVDAYHGRVRESLAPLLDADTAAWLAEATRPLGQE